MTTGTGRSQGYRPASHVHPGQIVPFRQGRVICPACQAHEHGSCWAHLHAIGLTGRDEHPCACGCHMPAGEPCLANAALEDMAKHGTLVPWVQGWQSWLTGSGPIHLKEPCRACAALAVHQGRARQPRLF